MIYRFVTKNSVEEKIIESAKQKLMLEQLVVSNKNKQMQDSKKQGEKSILYKILKFGT